MPSILSPSDVMQKGLGYIGIGREQQAKMSLKVKVEDFKAHYGSSPLVIANIWYDLCHTSIEEAHLEKVLGMIATGEKEGSKRAFGAERVMTETGGSYLSPGVFIAASNDQSLARQEIFGPVLTAIAFDSEEEAVRIANDTSYGLAGGVFTMDMNRAHRVSEALHAGTVWINTYDISSLATPFGGFKQSGFGRDRSVHAIDKYCDYKTIWQRFS